MLVPYRRATARPTGSRSSATTTNFGRAAAPEPLQRAAERHPRWPFRLGRGMQQCAVMLHEADHLEPCARHKRGSSSSSSSAGRTSSRRVTLRPTDLPPTHRARPPLRQRPVGTPGPAGRPRARRTRARGARARLWRGRGRGARAATAGRLSCRGPRCCRRRRRCCCCWEPRRPRPL